MKPIMVVNHIDGITKIDTAEALEEAMAYPEYITIQHRQDTTIVRVFHESGSHTSLYIDPEDEEAFDIVSRVQANLVMS